MQRLPRGLRVRPQLGGDDLSGLPSQLAVIIRALRDLAHSEPTVLDNDRRLENLLRKQVSTLPLGAANYCWFKDPAKAYSTYLHLKEEFGSRRNRMREAGEIADPKLAQIERLKDQVVKLKERVVSKDEEIEALTAFKQSAISRLVAQHSEIARLREALASQGNVRSLRPQPSDVDGGQ
jgi:hypothetical protein